MRPDQPSSTAVLIARSILLSGRDVMRRRLVAPGEAEAVGAILAGQPATWFDFASRHGWTRRLIFAAEQGLLVGASTHYLARKRWLEQQARSALDRGTTQVVVLGAGFDTLAWRLHRERPAVHFFELDHPATQAPKAATLAPGANLTFLTADLAADSPADILRACPSFRADRPSLFIAEGLLMYFPATRVATLLHELATLTRPRAELLFTFMEQAPDGSISFRGEHAAIGWWLRWRSEPFQWGCTRAALPEFLRPLGWQAGSIVDHDGLQASVLVPLGLANLSLARGECLCHASVIQS
jgi:methyltransferase (TIGR00027 family)